MKKTKGFSLVELMITVAIIGVLVLIGQPSYSDYVTRVRFTQLMTEVLGKHRHLETELLIAGDGDTSIVANLADELCIPGTVQYDTSGYNTTKFSCTIPKSQSIFPLTPGTATITVAHSISNQYPYIYYEEKVGGSQRLWIDATLSGNAYMNMGIPPEYRNLYGAGNHPAPAGAVARIMASKRGNDEIGIPNSFAPYVIKKGETTAKRADRGVWVCGFLSYYEYFYVPSARAMPSSCKGIMNGLNSDAILYQL